MATELRRYQLMFPKNSLWIFTQSLHFPELSFLLYLPHYKFSWSSSGGGKKQIGLAFLKEVFVFTGSHPKKKLQRAVHCFRGVSATTASQPGKAFAFPKPGSALCSCWPASVFKGFPGWLFLLKAHQLRNSEMHTRSLKPLIKAPSQYPESFKHLPGLSAICK